jgi:pre-mRNA-splicing factor ISY1
MLNRWIKMKADEGKPKNKRPFLASECDNVTDAERWRRDIVKDVGRKISQIQNREQSILLSNLLTSS